MGFPPVFGYVIFVHNKGVGLNWQENGKIIRMKLLTNDN
jgi:hypothetical protein